MRKVTLAQVARAAGCSLMHASRAFRDGEHISAATRQHILKIADELGYRRNVKEKAVAVIAPTFSHYSLRVHQELLAKGYKGVLLLMNDLDSLNERLFCGAISVGCHDFLTREWGKKFSIPLVQIHDYALYCDSISAAFSDCDNEMEQAVSYLAGLGHRNILWLREIHNYSGERMRKRGEKGFYGTAEAYGIRDSVRIDNFIRHDELFVKLDRYLTEGRVTAVIINEYCAYQKVLDTVREHHKRVPEDISLIVYESEGVTEFLDPPLTALAIDYETIVQRGVELFEAQLHGEKRTRLVLVPSRLIVRKSTGRCHV